jgi:formylglycine-generating enzyme required for sulfatase activity
MKTSMLTMLLAAGTLTPGALSGDITHQYGYDFLPIRDAGNANYGSVDPNTGEYIELYGSVDYEFRISRTATTATQWAAFLTDFVTAFGFGEVAGTRYSDLQNGYVVGGGNGFVAAPGREQWPVASGWRGAAIYCNWLHHGGTSDPDGLLVGAYDATTFGENGNVPTDQYEALPGARFWIPTQDEYAKASYYDHNQYGPGEGGYWMYPDAGDDPLISALPEDGGETNTFQGADILPVGSYPNAASAYGMLDVSGGFQEWTSSESEDQNRRLYYKLSGGGIGADVGALFDRVDFQLIEAALPTGRAGIRIATQIPSPSGAALVAAAAFCLGGARRRSP